MTPRRKLLPVVCALACVLGACSRPSTEAARDAATNQSSRELPAPAGAGASAAQPSAARGLTFRGEIGETASVEMSLRREGEVLSGSYFYEKVGKALALSGRIDVGGEFVLNETDAAGRQTGLFKGRWGTNDTGDAELTGQWSRPDGSRPLPFRLAEVPVELGAAARVVSRKIEREDERRGYTVDVEYPQVEGDARFEGFNRAALALAEREVAEFEGEVAEWEPVPGTQLKSSVSADYRVGLAGEKLVSVQFRFSTYFSGAAHPNQHTRTLNYDPGAGRELQLADLFRRDALYLRALSDYCVADLKRQFRKMEVDDPEVFDAGIEEGAAPNADNYASWLVTRGGVEVAFDPYQVAPYAAGPQRCVIPYAALREMIDPQGPAGAFVR